MDKRNIILSVIGILLLVAAVFGANAIIESNVKQTPPVNRVVKNVFVDTVQNRTVPITIPANGNLTALRKLELFSEVQGIFRSSTKNFRPGQEYRQGQVLINIDSEEFRATVRAAKSDLHNQIAGIMPDLRLDFPQVFQKWQEYLSNFDVSQPIPSLPEADSQQEKYFIAGRGITSAYYNIKNLEERLRKYVIVAPFDGTLTEAVVNPGTLVRPGQKLGEYIDPSVYELEVLVAKRFADFLKEGQSVTLNNLERTETYTGEVSRINARVDQETQTVQVFIRVEDEDVREGMYLEAMLNARDAENAVELPRELLVERSKLYVVRDSVLDLVEIDPVYFGKNTVVVKGLKDGQAILSSNVPGAYPGMLVNVQEEPVTTNNQ